MRIISLELKTVENCFHFPWQKLLRQLFSFLLEDKSSGLRKLTEFQLWTSDKGFPIIEISLLFIPLNPWNFSQTRNQDKSGYSREQWRLLRGIGQEIVERNQISWITLAKVKVEIAAVVSQAFDCAKSCSE